MWCLVILHFAAYVEFTPIEENKIERMKKPTGDYYILHPATCHNECCNIPLTLTSFSAIPRHQILSFPNLVGQLDENEKTIWTFDVAIRLSSCLFIFGKHSTIILTWAVVYFDQQTGAPHPICWSK